MDVLRRFRWLTAFRWSMLSACPVFVLWAGEFAWDAWKYNAAAATLADTKAQPEQFLAAYQGAMAQQRFGQAANLLKQRTLVEERLVELRRQFAHALPAELPHGVDRLVQRLYWDDARNLLAELAREYAGWPDEMQFEGAAELFAAQRRFVDTAHEQSLYDVFRKLRTKGAGSAYLKDAPLGVMSGDVEKYVAHLAAREQKHRFTIVLAAVEWPTRYPADDDNWVRYRLEGGEAARVTPSLPDWRPQ